MSQVKVKNKPQKKALSYAIRFFFIVLIIAVFIGGIKLYKSYSDQINIDNGEITAPLISLGPMVPGVLDNVFVSQGDMVQKNMIVATVSGQPIYAKTNGQVLYVLDTPGEVVNSQSGVVQMIQPDKLRLIGTIKENQGLTDLRPGQKVTFTVDAYGNREFNGVVESISPAPKQSPLSFSISNSRVEKDYQVKIRYNSSLNQLFKYGMSAKITIYQN